MNRIQTVAIALLVAALPFASATQAADRGHGDRGQRYQDHARGHDNGYNRHGHHNRHHYRHGQNGHHGNNGGGHYGHRHHGNIHYGQRATFALPFPPLPPFPFIVMNQRHHSAHIEKHR